MKTRKLKEEEIEVQSGGCCTPTESKSETNTSNDPCCEQPDDGSSCCDKSAPKEVNSEKTGCC